MKLTVEMKLIAMERQPKNSWRYEYCGSETGIETLYIKKSAQGMAKPPGRILVTILGEKNDE